MKMTRRKTVTQEVEVPDDLEGFKEWEFSSGTMTGKDFDRFAGLFKKFVRGNLPEGAELVKFSKGHYILSGFIEKDDRFVYFSVSDVRYNKNEWANEILVRKTEEAEDFVGGSNGYTDLENFKENVEKLLKGE